VKVRLVAGALLHGGARPPRRWTGAGSDRAAGSTGYGCSRTCRRQLAPRQRTTPVLTCKTRELAASTTKREQQRSKPSSSLQQSRDISGWPMRHPGFGQASAVNTITSARLSRSARSTGPESSPRCPPLPGTGHHGSLHQDHSRSVAPAMAWGPFGLPTSRSVPASLLDATRPCPVRRSADPTAGGSRGPVSSIRTRSQLLCGGSSWRGQPPGLAGSLWSQRHPMPARSSPASKRGHSPRKEPLRRLSRIRPQASCRPCLRRCNAASCRTHQWAPAMCGLDERERWAAEGGRQAGGGPLSGWASNWVRP